MWRILVPLQSLDVEIWLHRAAHFAITKMCYLYSVAKLQMEFEEHFQLSVDVLAQLSCRSVSFIEMQECIVMC